EGEELQGARLQLRREIDQHVAAQAQVDAREGRTLRQIVLAKDGQAAETLRDLVRAVARDEIAVDQVGGEGRERRRRVEAAPRDGDGPGVEVGREDAHVD